MAKSCLDQAYLENAFMKTGAIRIWLVVVQVARESAMLICKAQLDDSCVPQI